MWGRPSAGFLSTKWASLVFAKWRATMSSDTESFYITMSGLNALFPLFRTGGEHTSLPGFMESTSWRVLTYTERLRPSFRMYWRAYFAHGLHKENLLKSLRGQRTLSFLFLFLLESLLRFRTSWRGSPEESQRTENAVFRLFASIG